MKKIIAIGGFVMTLAGAMAQSVTVNIPTVDVMIDSGVYVTNGEAVTINANGDWSVDKYTTPYGPLGGVTDNLSGVGWRVPDGIYSGDDDMFLNNGIHSGVVAYIGGDDPYLSTITFPTSTGFWEIGSSRQFVSNTNGWLWIGVQDDAKYHNNSDNDGSMNVQVFAGYGATNSDWLYTRPVVTVSSVSSNEFTFNITSTNMPNSFWAVYDSADLQNWVLAGAVTLNDSGFGYFTNTTALPYRFYKVSNGQTSSRIIGFERLTIAPNSTNAIADQLLSQSANGNTLDGLFKPTMPDGTSLPAGTEILEWVGNGYSTYTWGGGQWWPNGSATLLPGGGVFLINNTNVSFTLTFAGLVSEGNLTISMGSAGNVGFVSSKVPQAGGMLSVLGLHPLDFDEILQWNGSQFNVTLYDDTYGLGSPVWYQGDDSTPAPEPVLSVGQAIFYVLQNPGETWTRTFGPSLYP